MENHPRILDVEVESADDNVIYAVHVKSDSYKSSLCTSRTRTYLTEDDAARHIEGAYGHRNKSSMSRKKFSKKVNCYTVNVSENNQSFIPCERPIEIFLSIEDKEEVGSHNKGRCAIS